MDIAQTEEQSALEGQVAGRRKQGGSVAKGCGSAAEVSADCR